MLAQRRGHRKLWCQNYATIYTNGVESSIEYLSGWMEHIIWVVREIDSWIYNFRPHSHYTVIAACDLLFIFNLGAYALQKVYLKTVLQRTSRTLSINIIYTLWEENIKRCSFDYNLEMHLHSVSCKRKRISIFVSFTAITSTTKCFLLIEKISI